MPDPGELGLYDDPRVYDVLHAPGTKGEVRGLEKIAKRFLGSTGPWTILEPACGTGRYLEELARRSHRVAGFDLSDSMVQYARDRLAPFGARASVNVGSFESFPIDRRHPAEMAFIPINSLRHAGSDRELRAHFARMHRAMAPRGIYVVGLSIAAYGLEQPTEDIWRGIAGGMRVTQVVQFLPPSGKGTASRRERVISQLMIDHRRERTDRSSSYWLRTYDEAQWRSVVRGSGFEIEATVDEFGRDITLSPPGYAIWILRRVTAQSARRSSIARRARAR